MAALGNIYQRISEIRKSVNYAQKDKTVGGVGAGYKAVTHDAVTAMIRNHLIDFGIVVEPKVVESTVVETGTKTQGGTPIIRYQARFDIAFVNSDRPEERAIVSLDAHANDQGDKAPGKALSYATKYAMLKLFSIETGEDEESRVESYDDFDVVTKAQVGELQKLVDGRVNDLGKFSRWLLSSVGVDTLDQVPQRKFDLVLKQLEGMPKKGAAKKGAATATGEKGAEPSPPSE